MPVLTTSGQWRFVPSQIAPAEAAVRQIKVLRGGPLSPAEMRELTQAALAEAASGRLRPVIGQTFPLERAADAYEREVTNSLAQVTSMLEPVMTLMMAGLIVFMILAVLMPIFQLNQLVQ